MRRCASSAATFTPRHASRCVVTRIEVLTTISGVTFNECYRDRVIDQLADIDVQIISLRHLKANKRASGRHKDLDDLEHLP